ncbi:Acetylornithine aminotransferase [Carbonactinospora thermoautotrophica]|uniref:Acetylornithine aminotransferase n=1 Tax=Carbonactinospora thermoautotrophica TaxID=1469144 RepID=A0A132MSE0_9ACTN|nr:acetylornithine transaminase [Carbonactinospora thermoautotrophica]KWX00805.1 Acetylornithine aminotransferase [Carbonactinospora thermoautotrophica]
MSTLEALPRIEPAEGLVAAWTERYTGALMNTFGPPKRVLVRGEGCHVWDADGKRYLDLLSGLAVNSLGHAHPLVVQAVTGQLTTLGHISNFFASAPQIVLAERLLDLLGVAGNGRVFFCNSGAEANEAAFKIARRTGRPKIVSTVGGFHGRTMGALALTGQPAKQEPFAPMPPGVEFVPYGDTGALAEAVDERTAAVILEPIQGENGVLPAPPGYLAAAREITERHGALLILDEVQTGVGRTGEWFAYLPTGITPDVVTLAKGLGAGIPIGACVGIGRAATLLGPGDHGTTFGGNPVACAAGLAVLYAIERDDLLANVRQVGAHLVEGIRAIEHPLLAGVRGAGLLLAFQLTGPHAARLAEAALDAGFIVNNVAPDAVRLAPPLILTAEQADTFLRALPGLLDSVWKEISA